jgi:hypothetical protein
VQRQLQLREHIGRRAVPRPVAADDVAVAPVQVEVRQAHAVAVVVRGVVEERDVVEAAARVVERAAQRRRPAAAPDLGVGLRHDLAKTDGGLDARAQRCERHQRRGARRGLGDQREHRVEHLLVEVQRERGEGHDDDQPPDPQPARAVQVEVELVAAGRPAHGPRRLPALPPGGGRPVRRVHGPAQAPGHREVERDEAVDEPHQRHRAHDPPADAVGAPHRRHVQHVVQLAQERHQCLGPERDRGRVAAPAHFGRDRIDEHLVVAELEGLAGGRVGARLHEVAGGVAFLETERHVRDPRTRIVRLDRGGQRERVLEGAAALRVVELAVEPAVDLVIPRDDGAGQARDDEEQRDRQARPAVDGGREGAHQKSMVPLTATVRGAPITR